ILVQLCIVDAVNSAFTRLVPASHPIRDIQSAIDSKISIGAKNVPEKVRAIHDFKARAFFLERKGMNAAARTTPKIAKEKVFLIFFRQTCSGIIGQPRRAVPY